MNNLDPLGAILTLILGGAGGAGIVGVVTAIRGWRTDKWANEGTLAARLNQDSIDQGNRADREAHARRRWEDQAGTYRRQLIENGITPVDRVWAESTGGTVGT